MSMSVEEYLASPLGQRELHGKRSGRLWEASSSLVKLIEARGFDLPDSRRILIWECPNLKQLRMWFEKAVHATDVEEIFQVLP